MFTDSSLRAKVQNAESKRVYRETLKKKMGQMLSECDTNDEVALPSFAFVNRVGLIECRLCGETFSTKSEFVSHLAKKTHLLAIEKLKL
jgi:hypothetical protein